ncbi:prolipoprotein diacylglyceryl transferase [Goodfellowiella coeruleoviolacea]|uniref:prolipoprotein diacylglyceryl transferase n=1 Tax=Goodfellowiella coeruleoviolacea TaxID=334858 RepID=UPI0020A41DBD|nr:prolipoprotein diacylglyceryl transferase [Goodfellowiella coeruleoviolacea]
MSLASTAVLATIPSPDRGVWHLGPIPLRAYAVCIIVGIVVAIWWGERRLVARGGEPGTVVDIAVFAVPFGLVGGRLYHVATDWDKYFGPGRNPLDALAVWNGGLGIWGAIALGGVGAWLACRRRGIPLPAVADAIAPGIVTAQAIGRLGNYFNQELYGAPTTVPWGLEIYQRVDPATGLPDELGGVAINHTPVEIVHPTFLYELLWNLGVALLVVWADRRFRLGHGRAFALYVAGYTAGRFWIELMRRDEATHVFGVRINVFTAALVFLGAVVYLVLARQRGEREDLAAVISAQRAAEGGSPSGQPVPAGVTSAAGATGATAAAGTSGEAGGGQIAGPAGSQAEVATPTSERISGAGAGAAGGESDGKDGGDGKDGAKTG